MIFQGGALLDSSNVEENVRLPLDLFTTMSMSEKRDRVNFCLKRVNLGDVNHLYPAEISGGMIKRVAIARAIVLNPYPQMETLSFSLPDVPKGKLAHAGFFPLLHCQWQ